jgi:hypothetical protein
MRRFLFFVLVAGCGGPDAPKSPDSTTHRETELPGTIDEAQDELYRARSEIEQSSQCEQLCRAFASMKRAQAALCVLTGEDDPRCTLAKQTVEENAKRVAKCSCPP